MEEAIQTTTDNAAYWEDLALNAFNASATYFDAHVRPHIELGIRQFHSEHHTGSKYLTEQYRLKSKLFRPMTRKAIRKHEAKAARALFSTEDVVNLKPVDDDNPTQQAAAKVYKYLFQKRLDNDIAWFLTAMGSYQEAMGTGVIASIQDWETQAKKGVDRPTITLVPPENVRIDPASNWTDPVNSSPYVIYMIPMYVKDVKERMDSGKWISRDDSEIKSARQGMYDTTRMVREGNVDPKDQSTAITDFTVVWVHMNIIEHDGADVFYYTLGPEKLLTSPAPLESRYFHGKRPIVIGTCMVETHKVYPQPFSLLVKPLNDEGNDLANLRLDNIRQMLNPRHQAKRNRNVDLRSITRNVAGSVTMVTEHDDVKQVETRDATGTMYAEQDRLNALFDDLAGGFSGSSVASNRNLNETVGGMNLLANDGDLVADYQMLTWIYTWVEPVLRQLIMLEREYESDEQLLAEAAQAAGIPAVTEEIMQQAVILKANVGIGNTNPQNQVDRFIYGLNALSRLSPEYLRRLKAEEVVKELFGKLGYKDGIRFFDFQSDTSDPLDGEIKQATLDKLKAEIEQIKSTSAVNMVKAMVDRVEVLYSAMQTAQTAATVPGVAPIADEIAKSAGFEDQNQPPVYPLPQPPAAAAGTDDVPAVVPHQNTSPMFAAHPAGPGEGMMRGIETQTGEDNVR